MTDPVAEMQELLKNTIDRIVSDDSDVQMYAHEIACEVLGIPYDTVIGDEGTFPLVLTEDDPRYEQYWNIYSAELVRALTGAAMMNLPHFKPANERYHGDRV